MLEICFVEELRNLIGRVDFVRKENLRTNGRKDGPEYLHLNILQQKYIRSAKDYSHQRVSSFTYDVSLKIKKFDPFTFGQKKNPSRLWPKIQKKSKFDRTPHLPCIWIWTIPNHKWHFPLSRKNASCKTPGEALQALKQLHSWKQKLFHTEGQSVFNTIHQYGTWFLKI